MKGASKIISLVLVDTTVLSVTACAGNVAEITSVAARAQGTAADTASKAEKATRVETSESETAAKAEETTYKIGVLQLVRYTALDATNDGSIAALDNAGIAHEVGQQNASGDQPAYQTATSRFTNERGDLVLAIATPAAQVMMGAMENTPVLVTAIAGPAEPDLVDTNEKPEANVIGTFDLTLMKEQIDLLKQLVPEAKTVDVLYCSTGSNFKIQVDMAKEVVAVTGIESKEYTVSSSNEIQTVVRSMVGVVDTVYTPANDVITADMATVGMVAGNDNLPIVCGETGMMQNSGPTTYGIDYYQLGYMTSQQAVKVLAKGTSSAGMSTEYLPVEECKLMVNEETVRTLGIDVSRLRQIIRQLRMTWAVLRGGDDENRFGLQRPLFSHRAKWHRRAE